MQWAAFAGTTLYLLDLTLKIVAIGTIPEGRRPSSSSAWLLLILFLPFIGFPLYWLFGSPYLKGRRRKIQDQANRVIAQHMAEFPDLPKGASLPPGLSSVTRMNRRLTGLPVVTGTNEGLYGDAAQFFTAMAQTVDRAESYVHVEFYIVAWDDTTDVFFTSLVDAVQRGVKVRLLMDHLGSRKYPNWKGFQARLTGAGIDWHLMMPILPLKGEWRRPDLRNHRKLMVVDGECAYIGSHNLIGPEYGSEKNASIGRLWTDLSVRVSGDAVFQIEAVFATVWYIETGELLDPGVHFKEQPDLVPGGSANALQVIPSGPGFPTEPNLRMFVSLVHMAVDSVAITSPYFVPDEALLAAITSAVHRGVVVDLFVGEEADQFLVGHAQRSYYSALLEAGVRIHLYPAPAVLHSKFLVIDGVAGAIGSSNMDFRSFALNPEVMMFAFGGDLVADLTASTEEYRAMSRLLTLEEWRRNPRHQRYIDNVCRLTSALM